MATVIGKSDCEKVLPRLTQQEDRRDENGFGIAAPDALAVFELVDLVVRDLYRVSLGLKDEDVVFPGIDEAIDLAGENGDGPSHIFDAIAELAGERLGDQGIGDPGEQQ